jgi:hypothetical protein
MRSGIMCAIEILESGEQIERRPLTACLACHDTCGGAKRFCQLLDFHAIRPNLGLRIEVVVISRWHHGCSASIASMTPEPIDFQPTPGQPTPGLCRGFVVAMRAKLIGLAAPFPGGPSPCEWMIVSRWGMDGKYVSISWTSVPADPGEAPIHLKPRQSALAIGDDKSLPGDWANFLLAPSLPEGITVAGAFVPAEGYVRLCGNSLGLRMRSDGRCLIPDLRSAWHVNARRAPWIGDFIDARSRS